MIGSIARLRHEQDALYELLYGLAHQFVGLKRVGVVDYSLMLDILKYLTKYADRYQHPYGDCLYRRLVERSPSTALAVKSLNEEHLELAARGRELHAQVMAAAWDNDFSRVSLCKTGFAYLYQYIGHLQHEEIDVIKVAIRYLTPIDWLRIDTAFQWSNDQLFDYEAGTGYQTLRQRITLIDGDQASTPAPMAREFSPCIAIQA